MGILKSLSTAVGITYYYYFVTKKGVTSIKSYIFQINTNIYTNYEQLTDEQVAFYLANPTATVEEVRKCELNPPYVPPTPEIETLRANAVTELKQAYCAAIKVSDLQLAAAAVDFLKRTNAVLLAGVEDIMDNTESVNTIKNFASSYNDCTEILTNGTAAINEATTAEAITEALTEYKSQLAAL